MRIRARLPQPASFPWARPRHEVLLLVLVALAMLTIMRPPGAQDTSRMCLTRAIVHGHLSADNCLDPNGDRALFNGHLYSDKPPGISVLAVPAAVAVRLPGPSGWSRDDVRLWVVRLSTGGIALLVCALLVGRVAEGLAPGWGGAVLVTFAAGSLAGSLAVDNFEEVPAAALAFTFFLLAWRRRPGLAGLVAGATLLVQYQTGLIAAIVGLYVALAGLRALGRYALGAVPGIALLGLYNRACVRLAVPPLVQVRLALLQGAAVGRVLRAPRRRLCTPSGSCSRAAAASPSRLPCSLPRRSGSSCSGAAAIRRKPRSAARSSCSS